MLVLRVELDIELTALVVVGRSHHRIHGWLLVFARIRIVRIVCGNDEVVHFFAGNLPTGGVFHVRTASGPGSILRVVLVRCPEPILDSKEGIAIELLASWACLIVAECLRAVGSVLHLIGHDSHRIDEECKVLLKVSRAQNFKLQGRNLSTLSHLLQHLLASFLVAAGVDQVILNLLGLENIEILLQCLSLGVQRHVGLRRCATDHGLLHTAVRVGGAAVAGAVLVLRVAVSLIGIEAGLRLVHVEVALPLAGFLVLKHLPDV